MPSNIIVVNNAKEFIVVDGKMEKVWKWLHKNSAEIKELPKEEEQTAD